MTIETVGTEYGVLARAVAAVWGLCLVACGGGSSAAGSATTDRDAAAEPPTFARVYAEILVTCSACHRPGQLAPFMDFSSPTAAYTALVRVRASGPSCGTSGDTRVVPGDASGSLLFEKISYALHETGSFASSSSAPS